GPALGLARGLCPGRLVIPFEVKRTGPHILLDAIPELLDHAGEDGLNLALLHPRLYQLPPDLALERSVAHRAASEQLPPECAPLHRLGQAGLRALLLASPSRLIPPGLGR